MSEDVWDKIADEADADRQRVHVARSAGVREFKDTRGEKIGALTPSLEIDGGVRLTDFDAETAEPLRHVELGVVCLDEEVNALMMAGYNVPAAGALGRAMREAFRREALND